MDFHPDSWYSYTPRYKNYVRDREQSSKLRKRRMDNSREDRCRQQARQMSSHRSASVAVLKEHNQNRRKV